MRLIAVTARICALYAIFRDDRMGIFVLNRLSFPTRKTCAPFGAKTRGDGVGSGPDYLAV